MLLGMPCTSPAASPTLPKRAATCASTAWPRCVKPALTKHMGVFRCIWLFAYVMRVLALGCCTQNQTTNTNSTQQKSAAALVIMHSSLTVQDTQASSDLLEPAVLVAQAQSAIQQKRFLRNAAAYASLQVSRPTMLLYQVFFIAIAKLRSDNTSALFLT